MFMLPIDISKLQVLAAGEARASIDRQTEQQRTDANGAKLYDVPAVFIGDGGAMTVNVRITHKLDGVTQGAPLKVHNLTVFFWQNGDRAGLSFRAVKIEVINSASSSSGQRS